MRNTRLIQRLDKPHGKLLGVFEDNPFSFGGGLKNGGLSDEAMGLLRGIFSFDYMGAAEFEFGAVPEALNRIANSIDGFRAWSIEIPLKKVQQDWQDKSTDAPVGSATVYILAMLADSAEVERRIRAWAAGKNPKDADGYEMRLKEPTMLSRVLRPFGEYPPRCAGWLELDNGFFFFSDREMWEGTCNLFGVEVPS